VNINQILINLASWFCNNVLLSYTKFQENRATHLYFITDFVNFRKEESMHPEPPKREKKTKKLSQTLRVYNLQMSGIILLKFGMWSAERGGCLQVLVINGLPCGCDKTFVFFNVKNHQ